MRPKPLWYSCEGFLPADVSSNLAMQPSSSKALSDSPEEVAIKMLPVYRIFLDSGRIGIALLYDAAVTRQDGSVQYSPDRGNFPSVIPSGGCCIDACDPHPAQRISEGHDMREMITTWPDVWCERAKLNS